MFFKIFPGGIAVLTILFVVLKLTHVIAWSWLWVVAPVWFPIALTLLGLLGFLGVALLLAWQETR